MTKRPLTVILYSSIELIDTESWESMNPFKITIVTGDLFCDREKETECLIKNMLSGMHTVMYAPRRYGKSSLAHVVLSKLQGQMVGVYVDLNSISSQEDVAHYLYRGIFRELGRKAVDKSSLLARIAEVFKNLQLGISLDPVSKNPEITVELGNERVETYIETVIDSLDAYCEKHQLKVCLVLDEFQEICNLKSSKKVEGLLRGGMQMAKNVTFLMLGSRRTVLRDMFEDNKRPFYKSADIFPLEKIPEEALVDLIEGTFEKEGAIIPREEAQRIVEYCCSYPYYVQKLARIYYDIREEGGSLSDAEDRLLEKETTGFENILLNLTLPQKRLLRAIAENKPRAVFAADFFLKYRLGSHSGVQHNLEKLKKSDLVEQQNGQWRVVDSILEKWLVAY